MHVRERRKTPLATFCLDGRPDMFMHPVLNKLLELKWNRFGLGLFLSVQSYFVVLIGLFTAGFLSYPCDCSVGMVAVRLLTGALSATAFLFMSYIALRQAGLGQTGLVKVCALIASQ